MVKQGHEAVYDLDEVEVVLVDEDQASDDLVDEVLVDDDLLALGKNAMFYVLSSQLNLFFYILHSKF